MRSWIWGGALAALTAVGVAGSVAPPRPTECVLEVAAVAPQLCAVRAAEVVPLTDALDLLDELRGPPSFDEPPLAPRRPDAPGEVIPAVFLLPAADAEEAPTPRLARELAPMPRPHRQSFSLTFDWYSSAPAVHALVK